MKMMLVFAAGLALGLAAGWLIPRKPAPPAPTVPLVAVNVPTPAVPPPSPSTTTPPAPASAPAQKPSKSAPAAPATGSHAVQTIDPNPRLEAALHDARARVEELEARIETQAAEHGKLASAESELRNQLARIHAETDELRKELTQRTQRISELEAARQRAVQDTATGQKNLARLRELAGDMDDLNRRREAYLNNVLTRYREATDLLRTMSLRLDNPRDAATPLNNDLSRIQQAVQNADEDLRQLRALNARAAKLQKDLAQASR